MNSLTDNDTGFYLVTTQSLSQYWLDLDQRLLRRRPRAGSATNLMLRRDGESVDLVEVVNCRVGQPLIVLINLNVPSVWFTTRESTAVIRIEPMPPALRQP